MDQIWSTHNYISKIGRGAVRNCKYNFQSSDGGCSRGVSFIISKCSLFMAYYPSLLMSMIAYECLE